MTRNGTSIALGLALAGLCVDGCDGDSGEGRGENSVAEGRAGGSVGNCNSLGYAGTCVGDVSLWQQSGTCRVRDCASEDKTCGYISNAVGYGCLQGVQGSTAFKCSDVGYEGACLSDDVLVWSEGSTCRWADCPALGRVCGWSDSVGYDCVEADAGDDDGGEDDEGGAGSGLLTIGEMLGGASYSISQDYGPTSFFGVDYSYCNAYGSWNGQNVHCGVDISIPHGTKLYIPGDATVLIAGESIYFEDVWNPAAGELKIKMQHDGAEVVMGHMSRIDVADGSSVDAGQQAGLSGSYNGAHLHLEVRVPDASFASGLRTVDPMVYFGE